jgi:type IV pilus assembly protein PilB
MSLQIDVEPKSKNFQKGAPNLEANFSDYGNELVDFFLKVGILTPKQVQHAQRVSTKIETSKPLTIILKELNFITHDQIIDALQNRPISMPLGNLLVELGHIHQTDLQLAKDIQTSENSKRDFDKILIDQGLIDEKALMQTRALKLGIPYIEPAFSEIDRTLFSMAPIKWYVKHNLIPVRREGQKILVASANPDSKQDLEAARQIYGTNLLHAITSKAILERVIEWLKRGKKKDKTASSIESLTVNLADKIISAAIERNASDIHMEPANDRLRVRFREDGVLVHFEDFPKDVIPSLTSRIKVMCNVDITEKRRHQGGRILFEYPEGELDLRVSFYVSIHGEKIVIRLLNRQGRLLKIEEVGMSAQILERFKKDALFKPSGVILITGPTGSGKTTTVYSSIHSINDPKTSIITAEEPVEYVIDGITQCSINPKINLTFEETLRHIVRQDPDVIVIGEIRDNFSAEVAVQAALTGHKVLTTFHTEDSIGGLIRLLNMNIEAFLISSTVVSVLAQRLVRKVCPNCREPYKPTAAELQNFGYTAADIIDMSFQKGRGCSFCQHTGYKGRVGIFELLVLDEFVRNAIIELKTSQEIRRISIESTGLLTLFEDGIFKAASGITTIDEVFRCLPQLEKPRPLQELRRYLGGI